MSYIKVGLSDDELESLSLYAKEHGAASATEYAKVLLQGHIARRQATASGSWWMRFEDFHQAVPEVFDEFARLASLHRGRGRTLYSASALVQEIRWSSDIGHRLEKGEYLDDGREPRALANEYAAYYARMLVEADKSFVSFFSWRGSEADDHFPYAAGLIAQYKGSEDEIELMKGPTYDGQAYYDNHIAPFIKRPSNGKEEDG